MLTTSEDGHKLELAVEVLTSGHTLRLRALGTSMLPSIWPGDILCIEPKLGREIVAGDIVLVARQHRFFIHRLIEKHDSRWITRGDSLAQNDDPVASCDVLGRVCLIHKSTGVTVPKQRRSLFSRALAWMLCHSDTLRTIALCVHPLCNPCSVGVLPAVTRASCPRP
jgi:hypothetical protein